jgi:radical SAM superfamily enzyme YgiQ (UPF0313 family)
MPQSQLPVLLLHPPVAKPCQPPAGIAKLLGALHHHGIPCTAVDMNLEGLLTLIVSPVNSADRWTQRAVRDLPKNLTRIRNLNTFQSFDRYQRTVADLNRVLERSSAPYDVHLNLANYQHRRLSPVRSDDLIRAAENPEKNPFFPYFQERLIDLLAGSMPSLVGISMNYLSQALCTFAIVGFLRRRFPGLVVVLGGGLVTSWMRRPGWHNPFGGLVDYLVAGAGESTLLSLAGLGGMTPTHFMPNYDFVTDLSLPGTASTDERKEIRVAGTSSEHSTHGPREFHYLAPGFILPYSSASGCYWNRCAFCPERAEGNPYVPLPVDEVMKELQILTGTMQPALLHVLDNAISPKLLRALSKNPPGVAWYGFARVTRDLAEEDFCRALRHSGCAMLQVGIESGDQDVLDSEHKGIDLDVVSRALRSLKKAGIATYVYLLFGTPSESLQEARKTLGFTVQHARDISFLNLAIFNLPIYGHEARELETRMHYDGDLSLYADFHHPRGWHRARVRQFLDKEFTRHPAIAAIIRGDPPVFTSNHAPFFGRSRRGPSSEGRVTRPEGRG